MRERHSDSEAGHPGRLFSTGLALICAALVVMSALIGLIYLAAGFLGASFGAWPAESQVTPMLLGALLLGVAPGLSATNRVSCWESARTLVYPVVIVVIGLFAISLFNFQLLHVALGGGLMNFIFSAGWLGVLGFFAALSLPAVLLQHAKPKGSALANDHPLPAWSKPLIALLGSAWFGLGAGLIVLPAFWGDFIPWSVNRMDSQTLGVLSLALGCGLLGALAEDDLQRLKPALLVVLLVPALMAVALYWYRAEVEWMSGPGLSAMSLISGTLLTGIVGHFLLPKRSRKETH